MKKSKQNWMHATAVITMIANWRLRVKTITPSSTKPKDKATVVNVLFNITFSASARIQSFDTCQTPFTDDAQRLLNVSRCSSHFCMSSITASISPVAMSKSTW
eukprot:CAMPEP_0180490800 /NCGR_PEP_ID=MMETSP1036_2-20121128/39312_1 /TAXON_ID=632150 /ORGANISM="Azadinium spinosum, Strain 3D9" /LENGTH=102 /DNA_ID=CAMNT_0022499025 /DNA_START=310 /DNA_END=618 /DNA_ORIENTATION=-